MAKDQCILLTIPYISNINKLKIKKNIESSDERLKKDFKCCKITPTDVHLNGDLGDMSVN